MAEFIFTSEPPLKVGVFDNEHTSNHLNGLVQRDGRLSTEFLMNGSFVQPEDITGFDGDEFGIQWDVDFSESIGEINVSGFNIFDLLKSGRFRTPLFHYDGIRTVEEATGRLWCHTPMSMILGIAGELPTVFLEGEVTFEKQQPIRTSEPALDKKLATGVLTGQGIDILNPESQAEVERAIESGDLREVTFSPGDLVCFRQTLHRSPRLADIETPINIGPRESRYMLEFYQQEKLKRSGFLGRRVTQIPADLYDVAVNQLSGAA